MIKLPLSINAWSRDTFNDVLKKELDSLPAQEWPLQKGLSQGSYALGDKLSLTILDTDSDVTNIFVKVSLFYTSIIAGCSCADDPTPVDEINEYCEVQLMINKHSGETKISLIE